MRSASLALALGMMALPRQAFADIKDTTAFSLGPSLGYVSKPSAARGLSYGVDAALSWSILWAGGGLRGFENGRGAERELLPYLEAGVLLVVNVGGGYTFDVDPTPDAVAGPHFFVGLPITTNVHQWTSSLYFEPYYRPTFADSGTMHEVGLLVKTFILEPSYD